MMCAKRNPSMLGRGRLPGAHPAIRSYAFGDHGMCSEYLSSLGGLQWRQLPKDCFLEQPSGVRSLIRTERGIAPHQSDLVADHGQRVCGTLPHPASLAPLRGHQWRCAEASRAREPPAPRSAVGRRRARHDTSADGAPGSVRTPCEWSAQRSPTSVPRGPDRAAPAWLLLIRRAGSSGADAGSPPDSAGGGLAAGTGTTR